MVNSQLLRSLTGAFPGIVWICDKQGSVEANNSHWSEFTGLPQRNGLGYGWLDAIHPADAAAFRAQLPFTISEQQNFQVELRIRRNDGVYHRHIFSVRHVEDGKWVGCAINAHEWLTAELRDATQGSILEMVTASAELDDVLSELCKAAEKQLPGATCSILLIDNANSCFLSGVAPNMQPGLMQKIEKVKIGTGVGSCGTAAFEKRDVVSRDIASDPLWDSWRDLILPLGYRACWSKPVFASDGEVIASFGFYFTEPREPTATELQEMTRLRALAALAIERVRTLEALRESEEHFRYTVEQNPQIPWTSDPQGSVLSLSSRWMEATGMEQADALGNGWIHALHPDDVAPTIESWNEALTTGLPLDITYQIRMTNGEYRWARARATARHRQDGGILRWYGAVEDIHEHHLANEKLKRQAYHDDLTGLPNRRRFVDVLRRHLNTTSAAIGLLVLDLDDFKLVNDRFGHLTGDAVLRLLGRYLQRIVEPTEFVARLGGDEFAIICRHISDDYCLLERARSIEAMLDSHLKANKKSKACKPSIGCAIGRRGDSADELFKRADLALYSAKSSGKGMVKLYDQTIRSAASKRFAALELARAALREGWIEAHYQPIILLSTHEARGFEALLRIRHPTRGLLAPVEIKDALDDPRLAGAIGVRMAHVVVNDMANWVVNSVPYGQVSINLATENVVDPEFTGTLLGLLDQQNLPRQSLKLEITERVLMDELNDSVNDKLKWMGEQGIGISLDDFGTGYASLVHLQTLPINEIKIDRSFVSGLGTSSNRGEIVQAMIGLAKTMGLTVVAEGIETQGEALMLSSWGCDYGQGYLFARPMPADAVPSYLEMSEPTGIAKIFINKI